MGKLLKCCQPVPQKRSFFPLGKFDSYKVYTSTYILWETYNTKLFFLNLFAFIQSFFFYFYINKNK